MANYETPLKPKTEILVVHRKNLWALDKEGLQYRIAYDFNTCADTVWIEVEVTSMNLQALLHAGTFIGKAAQESSNQLTAVA